MTSGEDTKRVGGAEPAAPDLTHPALPRAPVKAIRTLRGAFRREPTVEGLTPDAALHARRNFRLGVLNGIMFTLVEALFAPTLVLAWFANRLGAPNVLIGLLPAILAGGWFLPQLLVASRVAGMPRVMHWYTRVGIIRTLCMAALAVSTLLLAAYPTWLLVAFFVFFTTYSFSAGVSGIPWLEIVGKTISPRRRGTFFGTRNFWGGLFALAASVPLAAILSEELLGLVFPFNFAFLFGITTVAVGAGAWAWSSMKEPDGIASAPEHSIRAMVARGRRAVRVDRDFRVFLWARILLALATVSEPFYVVFATVELNAPPATVGLYVGAVAISALLSNFLWSPIADRASHRTLMLMTSLSFALVPLSAIVIALLAGVMSDTFRFSALTIVFVMSGLALGASRIVNTNMLLSIAPPDERPAYIGFLNTILGVVIFVPVVGGVVVDLAGFMPLFVTSLVLALAAVVLGTRMSGRHERSSE